VNASSLTVAELTNHILAQAEQYAEEALEFLPQDLPMLQTEPANEAREMIRTRLKVRFLFPRLTDRQVSLLVALFWQRQTLTRLVNLPQKDLPITLQPLVEQLTRQVEQSFMAMVSDVKNLIHYEFLSAAQRILFDQGYVRIPFFDPPG
jgi:hypothetical protein